MKDKEAGARREHHPSPVVVLARSGGLVLTYRRGGPGDDAEEFTVERESRQHSFLPLLLALAVAVAAAAWRAFAALLVAAASLALAASALLAVTSESLTVVRGVGVALETRRGRWAALLRALGAVGGGGRREADAASSGGHHHHHHHHHGDVGVHREFLDVERVRSAVVNEHVSTTGVRFYMALVVYNRPDMAVAFPHLMPRLEILIPVYRRVHFLLTGEGDGDGFGGGGEAKAAATGAAATAASGPPSSAQRQKKNE